MTAESKGALDHQAFRSLLVSALQEEGATFSMGEVGQSVDLEDLNLRSTVRLSFPSPHEALVVWCSLRWDWEPLLTARSAVGEETLRSRLTGRDERHLRLSQQHHAVPRCPEEMPPSAPESARETTATTNTVRGSGPGRSTRRPGWHSGPTASCDWQASGWARSSSSGCLAAGTSPCGPATRTSPTSWRTSPGGWPRRRAAGARRRGCSSLQAPRLPDPAERAAADSAAQAC